MDRKSLCAALLAAAVSAPLGAFELIVPIEGKGGFVQGQNPKRSGEENLRSFGGEADFSIAPILGWRGSKWRFTPAYSFGYSGVNNVLKLDEDLFLFTQQMTNKVDIAGAWRKNKDVRVNFGAFYESFHGKLAADEPWFKGLYDYQDSGVEVSWRHGWGRSKAFSSTLGLRATNRIYPNNVTLAQPEVREKDAVIVKPYLGLELKASDKVHVALDWSLQAVEYKEAVVVDDTGTTAAGTKRRDTVSSFGLSAPMHFGRQDLYLAYGLESRGSNYGVYDSNNNYFTEGFNDYNEHRLSVSWGYGFGAWGWLQAPQVTLDGEVIARLYANRLARDENGVVTAAKQADQSYMLALGFNSPLSDHWSLYTQLEMSTYRSNDVDQSSSLNNYTFNTFRLGGQFAY
jgi:hypothetical protein